MEISTSTQKKKSKASGDLCVAAKFYIKQRICINK